MKIKTIASALFACIALGALAASAAQAVEGEGWTTGTTENQTSGGTLIPNGTHEHIRCKMHGTSSLVFTSSLAGAPIEITAEGIDCLERAGSNVATIDNTTSKGHGEGVLTFTGLKVVKPERCQVGGTGHDITTEVLTDQVGMAGKVSVVDKFFTEGAAWDSIPLEGAECVLSGFGISLKGTLCGEFAHTNSAGTGFEPNKTGTLTKVQTLLFGKAQQEAGGCGLTYGVASLTITGAVDFELTSGKPFGAD